MDLAEIIALTISIIALAVSVLSLFVSNFLYRDSFLAVLVAWDVFEDSSPRPEHKIDLAITNTGTRTILVSQFLIDIDELSDTDAPEILYLSDSSDRPGTVVQPGEISVLTKKVSKSTCEAAIDRNKKLLLYLNVYSLDGRSILASKTICPVNEFNEPAKTDWNPFGHVRFGVLNLFKRGDLS
tara:strand:- start:606 stop:1154 length:549 start_codon:yes stop_codon:yes gene_type:complete